ncbi:CheR family methyltransferase [Desulfonatronum parangueonense]
MSRDFDRFLRSACPGLDLNWRKYRRKGARRRVDDRIRELGLSGYDEYLDYLQANAKEAAGLSSLMLVTVSRFFRDRQCWNGLMDLLPGLSVAASGTPRILSAGSCGGEEPYSLAIAWQELRQDEIVENELAIIALDLDERSLARAELGLYEKGSLRELAPALRQKWFHQEKSIFCLDPRIKEMVEFRRRNLLQDDLGGPYDMILCRYLFFTYFTGQLRRTAASVLWNALHPGGLLMIGAKEELGPDELALFAPHPEKRCLYLKY